MRRGVRCARLAPCLAGSRLLRSSSVADRFLSYRLFDGVLLLLSGYVIGAAVIFTLGLFGYRLTQLHKCSPNTPGFTSAPARLPIARRAVAELKRFRASDTSDAQIT